MTRANQFGNGGMIAAAGGLAIMHWFPAVSGLLLLIALVLTWVSGKIGSQLWWLSQLGIIAAFGLFALLVEHVH